MLQSPHPNDRPDTPLEAQLRERARALAETGGAAEALEAGRLPARATLTLSEGLVLGLLRQGVRTFFVIFGHGSTDLGNVLRVYAEEGQVTVVHCRNEVEMAHAATAHAWVYGETPAVVTSIGPGALQAMAGSLAAASNGSASTTSTATRRHGAKATTCSRSPSPNRACSAGSPR